MTAPDVGSATIPTVFDETASELATTYADALLNAAGPEAGAVVDELEELVADVVVGQPRFADLISSTSLAIPDRDRVLVDVFEGRAHPTLVKFLRVLGRHGRLALLDPIARRARAAWDRKSGLRPVTVRSAVPLDDAQRAALEGRLAALIGAKPRMTLEVDPMLIAGLVVQVGDDVYDASVRTRLARLRDRLIERKNHEIQSRRDHFGDPA